MRKSEISSFVTSQMDLVGAGYYVEWNGSDRERQMPSDFTYMWNLK